MPTKTEEEENRCCWIFQRKGFMRQEKNLSFGRNPERKHSSESCEQAQLIFCLTKHTEDNLAVPAELIQIQI